MVAKVYVSSTIADLESERRAVLDWLRLARHQAVDSYLPNSEAVRGNCLDDVAECDLYVLILGHRYGFVPPDGNPEGLSITQLEFRRAGECGIPRIALLRTSIPDASLSDLQDPARAELLWAFRAEVARAVRPTEFHDLQGLVQGLSTGILSQLDKLAASYTAARQGWRLPSQPGTGSRSDFFISHVGADRAWAEWVAWVLTDAGYSVELDVWDWAARQDFALALSDALARCDRLIALFSTAYFATTEESSEEWSALLDFSDMRLMLLRVEDVPPAEMPAVLRPLMVRDLFGIPEEQARRVLLEAVTGPRRPGRKPAFPSYGTPDALSGMGESGPQLSGSALPGQDPARSLGHPKTGSGDEILSASTPVAAGRIFVSYRSAETAYPSGWLCEKLTQRFGQDQVFKDIASIELGDDFVEVITAAVAKCDVLLALIGRRWLTISDESGRRRIDSPNDFVRLEIGAAIERNIRIIPILVDGARMPREDELPSSLAKLARRQALKLSSSRFDFEASQLLSALETTLTNTRVTSPVRAIER